MALSPEKIKQLYTQPTKPTKTKPIVRKTQFPILPRGGPVSLVGDTKRCASRGCSSATYYTFKGIPYCTTHLIIQLSHELVNNGYYNSSTSTTTGESDFASRFVASQTSF